MSFKIALIVETKDGTEVYFSVNGMANCFKFKSNGETTLLITNVHLLERSITPKESFDAQKKPNEDIERSDSSIQTEFQEVEESDFRYYEMMKNFVKEHSRESVRKQRKSDGKLGKKSVPSDIGFGEYDLYQKKEIIGFVVSWLGGRYHLEECSSSWFEIISSIIKERGVSESFHFIAGVFFPNQDPEQMFKYQQNYHINDFMVIRIEKKWFKDLPTEFQKKLFDETKISIKEEPKLKAGDHICVCSYPCQKWNPKNVEVFMKTLSGEEIQTCIRLIGFSRIEKVHFHVKSKNKSEEKEDNSSKEEDNHEYKYLLEMFDGNEEILNNLIREIMQKDEIIRKKNELLAKKDEKIRKLETEKKRDLKEERLDENKELLYNSQIETWQVIKYIQEGTKKARKNLPQLRLFIEKWQKAFGSNEPMNKLEEDIKKYELNLQKLRKILKEFFQSDTMVTVRELSMNSVLPINLMMSRGIVEALSFEDWNKCEKRGNGNFTNEDYDNFLSLFSELEENLELISFNVVKLGNLMKSLMNSLRNCLSAVLDMLFGVTEMKVVCSEGQIGEILKHRASTDALFGAGMSGSLVLKRIQQNDTTYYWEIVGLVVGGAGRVTYRDTTNSTLFNLIIPFVGEKYQILKRMIDAFDLCDSSVHGKEETPTPTGEKTLIIKEKFSVFFEDLAKDVSFDDKGCVMRCGGEVLIDFHEIDAVVKKVVVRVGYEGYTLEDEDGKIYLVEIKKEDEVEFKKKMMDILESLEDVSSEEEG